MKNKLGFTLLELLVVVLIIGVFTAVALPVYRKSVEKAKAVYAVAVLNDATKAEQDFALASSRYTRYWDDLVINQPNMVEGAVYCLQGENVANQDDCGSDSTYKVKLTVGDSPDTSVVMATRMPNNPYSDYKLFKFMNGDPNIYCKAATTLQTDICEVLGFPTKNLPNTKNIDREESFRCEDELSCNGATNGCLYGNPSFYDCERKVYDDGSYARYAYYPNGDVYDIFTYDADNNLIGDTWFQSNGNLQGMTFFENGQGMIDFSHSDPATGQNYNIRTWADGHWSELTGFYPDGSINDYRSWDTSARRWAYFAEYNEDGSIKKFTCYTAACGGSGNCVGEACASSQYASYIPNTSTIKKYNDILTDDQISQICQNPNDISFC